MDSHLVPDPEHPINMKSQFLVLDFNLHQLEHHDDLATEDQLPRLSLEPGLQHIRLQKLLKQQLCHFPRKLNLNRLLLLLHQDPPHFSSVTIVITLSSLKTD